MPKLPFNFLEKLKNILEKIALSFVFNTNNKNSSYCQNYWNSNYCQFLCLMDTFHGFNLFIIIIIIIIINFDIKQPWKTKYSWCFLFLIFTKKIEKRNTAKHLWYNFSIKTKQIIAATSMLQVIGRFLIKFILKSSWTVHLPTAQHSPRHLKIFCFWKQYFQVSFGQFRPFFLIHSLHYHCGH